MSCLEPKLELPTKVKDNIFETSFISMNYVFMSNVEKNVEEQ